MHNAVLIEWIRQASEKAELVLSVCTGALLMAKAGLLDGLQATTPHGLRGSWRPERSARGPLA